VGEVAYQGIDTGKTISIQDLLSDAPVE